MKIFFYTPAMRSSTTWLTVYVFVVILQQKTHYPHTGGTMYIFRDFVVAIISLALIFFLSRSPLASVLGTVIILYLLPQK